MSDGNYIIEARQLAGQCWSDPETSGIEMDIRLAEAMAKRIESLLQLRAIAKEQNYALIMVFASVGGVIPEGIYEKVENALAVYEAMQK